MYSIGISIYTISYSYPYLPPDLRGILQHMSPVNRIFRVDAKRLTVKVKQYLYINSHNKSGIFECQLNVFYRQHFVITDYNELHSHK